VFIPTKIIITILQIQVIHKFTFVTAVKSYNIIIYIKIIITYLNRFRWIALKWLKPNFVFTTVKNTMLFEHLICLQLTVYIYLLMCTIFNYIHTYNIRILYWRINIYLSVKYIKIHRVCFQGFIFRGQRIISNILKCFTHHSNPKAFTFHAPFYEFLNSSRGIILRLTCR